MADLFDNPMGLMGFEFVEFASPVPGVLEPVFERMGLPRLTMASLPAEMWLVAEHAGFQGGKALRAGVASA